MLTRPNRQFRILRAASQAAWACLLSGLLLFTSLGDTPVLLCFALQSLFAPSEKEVAKGETGGDESEGKQTSSTGVRRSARRKALPPSARSTPALTAWVPHCSLPPLADLPLHPASGLNGLGIPLRC
jgi:hypothetical protein